MDLPTSTFAVAVVVALVVPGIVYAGTRAALTGYRGTDKVLGTKLAEAVTVSVVLDAAYLVVLRFLPVRGLRFVTQGEVVLITDPSRLPRPAWASTLVNRINPVAFDRVPTAWDFAARSRRGNFVRVRRSDGTVVGGWYGDDSYLSGYPEARDLFVQEQYAFDEHGVFLEPLPRSAGTWISIRDDDIIECSK